MVAILRAGDRQLHPGPLFNSMVGSAIHAARSSITAGLTDTPIPATDVTDSSTGTSDGTVKAIAIPPAFTTGGAGTCSPKAGFDTAMGKIDDAFEAVASVVNVTRTRLGFPTLVYTGAPAVAATIPALDKVLTGTTGGVLCVDAPTGIQELTKVKNNLATLALAVNECLGAVGRAKVTDNSGGTASSSYTLYEPAATAAGNDGTASKTLADAAVDLALTAIADSFAAIALAHNTLDVADKSIRPTVTDSSTGTVLANLSAVVVPVPFTHVTGADCAPKAGFDTAIAASYEAAKALGGHINLLRNWLQLYPVVFTGQPAAPSTIPAQTKTVTGVDGVAVTAVDYQTAKTELNKARNNLSVVARATYEVLSALGAGVKPRDNTGGMMPASGGYIMSASAATAAGTNGTAANTMPKIGVDAALTSLADGYATLSSAINAALAMTASKEKYAQTVYIG